MVYSQLTAWLLRENLIRCDHPDILFYVLHAPGLSFPWGFEYKHKHSKSINTKLAAMRVSIASALGLLVTSAIAECPYAKHQREPSKCPYASKLVRDSQQGALARGLPKRASPSDGKLGIFYMNRIAPSGAQLWIADTDGSNAIPLMANQSNPFDYHPSWSLDGEWIVFTSERRADGQSDLYRIKPDCTGLETLVETD